MTEKVTEHLSVQLVEVAEDSEGQRIDNFLLKKLKGVPKSKIYRCMRKGEVRVNGGRVKAQVKLKLGDVVRIPPIRVSESEVYRASDSFLEGLERSIIYEDGQLLVINKVPGIAVHGGSGIKLGVIEGLRQLRPQQKFLELVHRLDRDTSGCLMISKKRTVLNRLQSFLREKTELEKHYLAIVHGKWPKRKQHLNFPVRKDTLPSGERICVVAPDGKPSLTKVKLLVENGDFSLLEVSPITGRTHQIRVHCKHLGHPIVGDSKYGLEQLDKELGIERLMLHARKLVIPPLVDGGSKLELACEPGKEFTKMSNKITKQNTLIPVKKQ